MAATGFTASGVRRAGPDDELVPAFVWYRYLERKTAAVAFAVAGNAVAGTDGNREVELGQR